MKCCVSTDVGTWTNWLTFAPDPDYSPDAGTELLSPISYKRCYAEFYYVGKIPRVHIDGSSLQQGVVLKWFYSPGAVGTALSEVHALYRLRSTECPSSLLCGHPVRDHITRYTLSFCLSVCAFELSGDVTHVRNRPNRRATFRSQGQRSRSSVGVEMWKSFWNQDRVDPQSMLHVSSNTKQQRKYALFTITVQQCWKRHAGGVGTHVSTHHSADIYYTFSNTSPQGGRAAYRVVVGQTYLLILFCCDRYIPQ